MRTSLRKRLNCLIKVTDENRSVVAGFWFGQVAIVYIKIQPSGELSDDGGLHPAAMRLPPSAVSQ